MEMKIEGEKVKGGEKDLRRRRGLNVQPPCETLTGSATKCVFLLISPV
jgi:hypothetical protein